MRTWLLGAALVLVASVAVATDNYGLIESKPNGAAYTQTGDVTISPAGTEYIFGVDNDAVTPALSLEPGTGFYASADNTMGVSANGANIASWAATGLTMANANGASVVNAASSATVPTLLPDRAGTGGIGGTSSGLSFISASTSWATMSTAGVWSFRPTSPPATHFQVGSSGTLGFMMDSSTSELVVNTGTSIGFNGWLETVTFCGDGPNATTEYIGPNVGQNLFASAGCAALDSTTEATADQIYWPYAVRAMSAHCGIDDKAAATVTFTLRSATANVDASDTCTTSTGDAAGYLDCYFQDLSPSTIAAGTTIDFLVSSGSDFSAGDVWCVLQVSR